jgi:hypothetical protein
VIRNGIVEPSLSVEEVAAMAYRSAIVAVLRRPRLWFTAVTTLVDLAPNGWWKRPPFLPIPNEGLVNWRLTTAYGSSDTALDEADLVAYLEWRRQVARGSGG